MFRGQNVINEQVINTKVTEINDSINLEYSSKYTSVKNAQWVSCSNYITKKPY